ncbi:MAG: NHL repeat-containing protein, partial [Candidatus Diapherotrites archaeon]|nr:NHL repeat-containing protein [Candidatus Diapherotrites archaeon]
MPQNKEVALRDIRQAVKKAASEKEGNQKGIFAAVIILVVIAVAIYFFPQVPITPPITPPASPSCVNGVQDSGEEGVDCGGICFGECVVNKDPGYALPSTIYDVAVDKEDRILLVDKDRDRVMLFSPELKYLRNIGETGVLPGGTSNAQLSNPLAVGVSPVDGKIFISDEFNLRIQVFDSALNYAKTIKEGDYGIEGAFYCMAVTPDNKLVALSKSQSTLYLIGETAVEKKLDTGLSSPEGCAAAADGKILVADSPNHVVKVFDSSLQQVAAIGSGRGSGQGQFNWPTGIALDRQGNVYVADSENKRVQVFNPNYSFKAEIKGSFVKPTKVAVDSRGRIIVGDVGADKVIVFSPSLTQVGVLEGLTRPKYEMIYFTPRYVAVAPDGTVFASEEVNQRVVVLNSDFSFRAVIGESLGQGNTQFFSPLNMAVDKQGNLYVADKDNHRVQVFDSSLQFVKTIGT